MQTKRVIVVRVKAHDFRDERTGRQVVGGSIEYIGDGRSDTTTQAGYREGLELGEASVPKDVADRVRAEVPGVFDLSIDYVGDQGNIKRVCKGAKKVAGVEAVQLSALGFTVREQARGSAGQPAAAVRA